MKGPILIGIAGPSCSGKSLIADRLARLLGGAGVLSLDSYYRDLSDEPPEERETRNFDLPEALDRDLLVRHLASLARGEAVEVPGYDFAAHVRMARTISLRPDRHIIVEGLFALYWPEARDFFSMRVYVHLDDAVCLRRRLERDVRERGRSRDSILEQYSDTVRPMCEAYVLPTMRFADIVVDGEDPVDVSVAAVLDHIEERTR
jgi:uridine kinase